jgi:hypothetical protein
MSVFSYLINWLIFNILWSITTMKTVFEKVARAELINRINTLDENSNAQWGKMNVYQMVTHCTRYEEWIQGKNNPEYKQAFIGRLFGKMALKQMTKDERPLGQSTPTLAAFKIKETTCDIAAGKNKWIALIEEYEHFSNPTFIHSFFGKMTKEQVGHLGYKHSDHHLRQFGA